MKNLFWIILLFLPIVSFSQSKSSAAFFNFLVMYKGAPPSGVKIYSYPGTLKGYVLYDCKRIDADFTLKNNFIKFQKDSIYVGDKKMSYLELKDEENTFKFERISSHSGLSRVVTDTLDFRIYENFNLSQEINKRKIFFKYKDEYYVVRKSIFRRIDTSILKTLDEIDFEDPALKQLAIARLQLQ
ncbi:hypothetical protein NU09_3003 [Flavobacterium beibuense]|uniref:Uncharacterized protein n=2 Tax=Flavobacterium beibuense TaxID=657326 RepID=A0A444W5W5_9FLAO|nr:hypothetical protein NU09_3003 [Flavobacterium beibuense]